jgi:hypothetical protein
MPTNQSDSNPLEDVDVDAMKVVSRVGQYDPHLLQRCIAEEQRDLLVEMIVSERELNSQDGEKETK